MVQDRALRLVDAAGQDRVMLEYTDTELAESLQDLLSGWGRQYHWRVLPLADEGGRGRRFEMSISDGTWMQSRIVSRLTLDTMQLSLWDFAQTEAQRMIHEFEHGRPGRYVLD